MFLPAPPQGLARSAPALETSASACACEGRVQRACEKPTLYLSIHLFTQPRIYLFSALTLSH